VTEPDEFDEFRRRWDAQERRTRIAIRIVDFLTALTLAALAAVILKMILF